MACRLDGANAGILLTGPLGIKSSEIEIEIYSCSFYWPLGSNTSKIQQAK